MRKRLLAAALLLTSALFAGSARATEPGDITREALYTNKFSDGIIALAPFVEAGDEEAIFGTALIRFVRGLETVAFQLYTYGLTSPRTGPMGPVLAVPVPENPNPSPLTYEGVRGILEALEFNLGTSEADFIRAGESGDWVLLLDPLQIRIDVNGDGQTTDAESIAGIFQLAGPSGAIPEAEPVMPGNNNRSQRPSRPAVDPATGRPDTTVGLDRADALWFAGYTNIILAQAEFLLAHDFSDLVNSAFHRLFPQAGFPMQDYSRGGSTLMADPETDTAIADAIAALHSLNWPVVDAERLKHVRERALRVIDLSRRNWQAILAETDDQRELVPSPRQTSIIPGAAVTQEVVDAWLATLDTAEQVLNGELLIPHWRFRQGFDLKAYFEHAERTDFVMLLTGYAALPFLKDGPIASAESFAAANRVFGRDFLGYALWFN